MIQILGYAAMRSSRDGDEVNEFISTVGSFARDDFNVFQQVIGASSFDSDALRANRDRRKEPKVLKVDAAVADGDRSGGRISVEPGLVVAPAPTDDADALNVCVESVGSCQRFVVTGQNEDEVRLGGRAKVDRTIDGQQWLVGMRSKSRS